MKQRFSSLDIKVIAYELSQSLLSLRVVNIYDLSSRIFLIKLAKPDHREQFIVDSGFRCHLTSFARTTAAAPSAFVARLRKFLKTRRVTAVTQVGTDRILEFQFSDGQYRLFLEFYAGGNIVLTDKELHVIALLRNVNEGAEHEQIRLGSVYNLSERQNVGGIPELSTARVRDGLQKFLDRQAANCEQVQSKKSNKRSGDTLRRALAGVVNEFPPMLLEHALRVQDFDSTLRPEEVINDNGLVEKLMAVLEEASRVVTDIMNSTAVKGYIMAKPCAATRSPKEEPTTSSDGVPQAKETPKNLMYDDYHPFRPRQFEEDPNVTILEYDGFNRAVDDFYSSIEGQKLESRLHEKEAAARKKLDHARQDQAKRIDGLQAVQELNVRKAQAIEANLERVEEATMAINGLIAQGMDWVEINALIELEQNRNNPVAEVIKLPLKLNENTATLLLGEWEYDEDEADGDQDLTDSEPSASEDETEEQVTKKSSKLDKKTLSSQPADKRLTIDIDLALSGWSNAREYYDQKKTAAVKEEKTMLASTKALKSAQHKIEADLKRALKQEKQVLRPVRKALWFEKFIYFISSDGYLVLGGKDAQQNDILYKRYLKKGDVYVHADLNGAAIVMVKNKPATPDAPIPPSTLSQAGTLSIATSSAWESKAVMSAWWVPADQVTKMAPSGDYMSPGTFSVRGNKNFLPPAQLLLGFAVLFQISEESKIRHTKHRVPIGSGQRFVDEQQQAAVDGSANNDVDVSNPSSETDVASDKASGAHDYNVEAPSEYSNPLQVAPDGQKNDDVDRELGSDNDEHSETHEADADRQTGDSETALASEAMPNRNGTHREDFIQTSRAAEETDDSEDEHEAMHNAQPAAKAKGPIPVRGKRGKKKKMATKYADQDEEDRALAMQLLGSKAGQEKAEADAQAKKAKDEEAAAQKLRRKQQHQRVQQEGKQQEEGRRLAQGDGGEGDVEDEEEGAGGVDMDLDALVGTPLPGDEILEAIPVCAPWSALGRYKYKAKLQPGSQKKGKAIREILGRWTVDGGKGKYIDEKADDVERIWPRELELIKAWKDTEVFNVLPVGKVRVLISGAAGGKDAKGQGKGKPRGGKGSKKSR